MTEKLMFVGSVGPLYFDDAEKSYDDVDMLPDDAVSPLQRAVWSDGDITAPNVGGTSDTTAPGPATGLALVDAGLGGISISWTKPADADVYAYRVYGDVTSTFNIATTNVLGTVLAPTTKYRHSFNHPLASAYTWYYWIVVLDKTGNASTVLGPLTVSNTTSTYDKAITNVVSAIIDNTEGKVTFLGDRIKIAPPSGTVAATIYPFYTGLIDGVTAVALKGDLFVDGTVNAKCITANTIVGNQIKATTAITLNEGGTLSLGNSGSDSKPDVAVITNTGNGQGKLIVYDGVSNAGYNSTTEFWRSCIAHYVTTASGTTFENPPRRMVTGFCKNRTSTTILGDFPHMPQLITWPISTVVPTGKTVCHPGPLNAVGFGQWSFTMYCAAAGSSTHFRAPNEDVSCPYSTFTGGYVLTSPRIYCREDGTSNYAFTRVAVRVAVRSQSGAGTNPTGSLINVTIQGRYTGGLTYTSSLQVYADTDWRSYWLMIDSPDGSSLYDSIVVTATHAGAIQSRYRWPSGTGQSNLRVESVISYPSVPATTYEVGGYLAFF